jgi:hypothetical protein
VPTAVVLWCASMRIGMPSMKRESPSGLRLRAGDWVEVRSKEEILDTLDENGRLDRLPFMPEMFQYCGRRLRVFKRAHKTCDTVNKTGGRRMTSAVHLEDARCDGASHGGCQAACLLFWKEAWLKRVPGPGHLLSIRRPRRPEATTTARRSRRCTEEAVAAATRTPEDADSEDPSYVCQATTLPGFTTWLPWWDVRQYVEDYTSGNATLRQMFNGFAFAGYFKLVRYGDRGGLRFGSRLIGLYDRFQRLVGGVPFPEKPGTRQPGVEVPSNPLDIMPGDVVRVKSHPQILTTLDARNKHRGMYLGSEEVPFCGRSFRVRSPVSRIISEQTGKMLHLKGTNVILEGAWCQARYSDRRLFCPRAIYAFWREEWLDRTEPATGGRATRTASVGRA